MNILILSSFYKPEKGAAPHRITTMCNELKKRGHQITVITTLANYPKGKFFKGYKNTLYKFEIIDGIKVFRYWFLPTNSNSSFIRVLSTITSFLMSLSITCFVIMTNKKFDFSIIQTPPLMTAFSYSIICRLFGLNYLLNISDIWPLTALNLGAMKRKDYLFRILTQIEFLIYKYAQAFLCQSQEITNYISGFNNKKFLLYRNLTKKNITNDQKNYSKIIKIVYAGLLGNAQGLFYLSKTLDWVGLNAQLHIYGDGLEKNKIRSIKNNNIFFHEPLSKDEIQKKLNEFDFSLVPLRVKIIGAFPSKISASISSGVPVLYVGEGEGYSIVQRLQIGESFKNNELPRLSEFLISYSKDKKLYVNKYKKGIKLALENEFNYKRNFNRLEKFLLNINKY